MSIREDHITTQYIWTLENEQVFVTKARHEAERNNFYQFTRLVQVYSHEIRRQLGDAPSSLEWAFIYVELWHRMGGHKPHREWHSDNADKYHISMRLLAEHAASQPIQSTETKEETTMTTITIKNVTLINNTDVSTMTDDQLINAVRQLEQEISHYESVKTESKKIKAKVADLHTTLAKVVEVLDAR